MNFNRTLLNKYVFKFVLYFLVVSFICVFQYFLEWKSVGASLIVVLTYLLYRPVGFFHPCNVIAAFYMLYLVLPSSVNLYFDYSNWEYLLPWGQFVFWNEMSAYSIYQIQFTFISMYLTCYKLLFKYDNNFKLILLRLIDKIDYSHIRMVPLFGIYILSVALYVFFITETGGFSYWFENYSSTYLHGRAGFGWLLTMAITLSNITVFYFGIRFYQLRNSVRVRMIFLILAFSMIFLSGFAGGFKSRIILLIIIFYVPTLMSIKLSLTKLTVLALCFFTFLFLLTYVRSEGFYGTFGFFLEGLVGYFNTYYLHDMVVQSRDPSFFTTTGYFLNKPLMMLGLIGPNHEYDLSIMLTKEFYPNHWYIDRATQQWPLETDLYLNFGGFYLQLLPVVLYATFISAIYKLAFVKARLAFILIAIFELIRIMTTLRWVLIPWDIPIWATQYAFYYLAYLILVSRGNASASSRGLSNV